MADEYEQQECEQVGNDRLIEYPEHPLFINIVSDKLERNIVINLLFIGAL